MPSAANVKVEQKQQQQQPPQQISPTSETPLGDGASTPLRQAITIIEHKIRNLEKRKAKLESYRDLQNSGKELHAEQKTALAKINEVIMTLDFARDMYKQFLGIASSSEKEAKKQAKREASLKNQAELARLREILLVQDALNQMGADGVREDFLNGRNGAAQLTDADLKLLDDLYPAVIPKHEAGNPIVFTNEVQAAAEHLLAVVDGKPKEIFGGTYSQIKEILGKIHESGYFDQAQELGGSGDATVETFTETVLNPSEIQNDLTNDVVVAPIVIESTHQVLQGSIQIPLVSGGEPAPILTHHAPVQVIDPVPARQPPPNEIYYQNQPQQQPQPPRPIADMLNSGSFYFLQESEIDPPEQIASQTYTNQQFVVQPTPMQLPPQFQGPQSLSPGTLPPSINHQVPPNGVPPVVLSKPLAASVPINDNIPLKQAPVAVEEIEKQQQQQQHSMGRVSHAQSRNNHHQPPQQSFYNNGYNNNNRSNRSGHQQTHARNNGVPPQGRPQSQRH